MMVGRPSFGVERDADTADAATEPVLRIRGLHAIDPAGRHLLTDLDLDVRGAEIVGVAGVSGNGQTELIDVLCGMRRPSAGTIHVGEHELTGADPTGMMAAGIGRIPEDRHASLVGDLSVAHNLVLEHLDDFRIGGRIDERRVREHARELIERYDIRATR